MREGRHDGRRRQLVEDVELGRLRIPVYQRPQREPRPGRRQARDYSPEELSRLRRGLVQRD